MTENYDLIVAGSEKSSDLRYLTGFAAPDEFIYFGNERERGVIVSELERDRAKQGVNPGIGVYGAEDFSASANAGLPAQITALASAKRITAFRVPADFPLLLADRLRQTGLTLTPETGVFCPARVRKSRAEVAEITRAIRIAEAGVRKALAMLAEAEIAAGRQLILGGEPLTSERLRTAIDLELASRGALPTGTIVAGGRQSAEPHHTGSGPLYADVPIVIDVFPRLRDSGYWGDLTRTVIKGKPSTLVENAYRTVKKARDFCKTLLRAGAIPARVHEEAVRIMNEAGFRTGRGNDRSFGFFHSLGHGLGLDIHEAPRLGPRNETPLAGGEVVTVEPGLYYPEWGGIRLEDVVYLGESGAECLTEIEDFPVIP